tara:strand:- start:1732 stop:2229 length:498 start_codon:yes stop_codon:yes gene_type:complete
MWAVLKIDKKNLALLKNDFFKKLGKDVKFFMPKLKLKKFVKKKIYFKESFLLEDYMLCFHKDFSKKSVLTSLKYCKGLKYFLMDFLNSQKEIEKFISKCKENEDENGFLKSTFFDFANSKSYEFISGPFTNMIFNIINENKLSIKALLGNYTIIVSKGENLFRPV